MSLLCTQYTTVEVVRIGPATPANGDSHGVYKPAGTFNGYTIFTKTGNLNSIPRIRVENNRWVIRANLEIYGPWFDIYSTQVYNPGQVPVCPVGLNFIGLSNPWGTAQAITVTGQTPIILTDVRATNARAKG